MDHIFAEGPPATEAYDTTLPAFEAYVEKVEAWFAARGGDYAAIDEEARRHPDPGAVLGFRIALKIAESRRILAALDRPVTLTLLNPVYKETGRIQRREEHPHGENSIRYKAGVLKQLELLNPHLSCQLVVIDDECPDGSGQMAAGILESDFPAEFANGTFRVLMLRDAIDDGDPELPPGLTHKDGANRSVKGGALLFGARKMVGQEVEGLHILVDNDADLSVHPAQLGLLVEAIAAGDAGAVAGSRREDDSVALIGGSRNVRGRLFIKIWQHLLPELATRVTDTNRAFKAFSAEALARILSGIEI
nr:glycosyltransferase [Akkermansiaceae bacterium]